VVAKREKHELQTDIPTATLYAFYFSSKRNISLQHANLITNANQSISNASHCNRLLFGTGHARTLEWATSCCCLHRCNILPDGQANASQIAGLGVMLDLKSTITFLLFASTC
jgi:hypothetical protein